MSRGEYIRTVSNCGRCPLYSSGGGEPPWCGHEDGKHPTDAYSSLVTDLKGPGHMPSDCPLKVRPMTLSADRVTSPRPLGRMGTARG
jgi:hypothetical protein